MLLWLLRLCNTVTYMHHYTSPCKQVTQASLSTSRAVIYHTNCSCSAAANKIGLLTAVQTVCIFYLFIVHVPIKQLLQSNIVLLLLQKDLKIRQNKFGLLLYCCLRDPQIFREFNQKMPSMSCQSAVAKVDCGKIIKPA